MAASRGPGATSSPKNVASSSDLPEAFLDHRRQSHELISQAVRLEEEDDRQVDRQLLIGLYKLGLEEIEKCYKVATTQTPKDSLLESLRKLSTTRKKVEERIEILRLKEAAASVTKEPDDTSSRTAMPSTKVRPEPPMDWQSSLRQYPSPRSNPRGGTTRGDPLQARKTSYSFSGRQPSGDSSPPDERELSSSVKDFINGSILTSSTDIQFSDVIGLDKAKQSLRESIILPQLRPELFSGLCSPSQGLLLFGPPGNGKTLLVKALATETRSTLFNVTAAVVTSKYVGEGEKLVKCLFQMARRKAPSIIFIDEIDSILSARKSSEHEASRRLKTEFFTSFDGLASKKSDRILVIGATNRPDDLDPAAIRRLTKRIYIPLPDDESRQKVIQKLLLTHNNSLTAIEIGLVAKATCGYSASDLTNLAKDAAFGPIREVPTNQLATIKKDEIRPVNLSDFRSALTRVRPSVNKAMLKQYQDWNTTYGDVS